MKRGPVHFDKLKTGYFAGPPELVRMSKAVKLLRDQGRHDLADALVKDARLGAPYCPTCGRKIDDPPRMAFACAHCSDPAVFEQWEREGEET